MDGPYFALLPLLAMVIGGSWLLSVLTRNYSWVDRLWSIMPPVYLLSMAWRAGFGNTRLNLMALLATLWGVRLSYNFARKGGYRLQDEDYRWAVLREHLGPVGFQVFNATFIAPYQNLLLFLLVAPAHAVAMATSPLGARDFALTGAFLALLVGETMADQQQWQFHKTKARAAAEGKALAEPFCTTGLFRFSRHPNFFCEIAMWWVFFGFALALSPDGFWWTGVGALLLHLLFLGSTAFTERITLGKYPSYAAYQRTTSRLIPWPPAP